MSTRLHSTTSSSTSNSAKRRKLNNDDRPTAEHQSPVSEGSISPVTTQVEHGTTTEPVQTEETETGLYLTAKEDEFSLHIETSIHGKGDWKRSSLFRMHPGQPLIDAHYFMLGKKGSYFRISVSNTTGDKQLYGITIDNKVTLSAGDFSPRGRPYLCKEFDSLNISVYENDANAPFIFTGSVGSINVKVLSATGEIREVQTPGGIARYYGSSAPRHVNIVHIHYLERVQMCRTLAKSGLSPLDTLKHEQHYIGEACIKDTTNMIEASDIIGSLIRRTQFPKHVQASALTNHQTTSTNNQAGKQSQDVRVGTKKPMAQKGTPLKPSIQTRVAPNPMNDQSLAGMSHAHIQQALNLQQQISARNMLIRSRFSSPNQPQMTHAQPTMEQHQEQDVRFMQSKLKEKSRLEKEERDMLAAALVNQAEKEVKITSPSKVTYKIEHVKRWTQQDVVGFLVKVSPAFIKYADSFIENEIDGKAFLALLNVHLKDLGVTIVGHRSKILSAIQSFGPGC